MMAMVRAVLGALAALLLIGHTAAYTNGRLLHRSIEAENKMNLTRLTLPARMILQRENEVSDPAKIALANRVLERILDVSMDIFREIGATGHEMEELKRKRNVITACYFQAVSCY